MAGFHRPRLVILSTAIAAGIALIGSISLAHACPFSGKKLSRTVNNPVGLSEESGRSVRSDRFALPADRFQSYSSERGLMPWGIAGSIASVGLVAAGVAYKTYRSHRLNAVTDEVLFDHPHLEHPELSLTFLPKEAFSCQLDRKEPILNR